MPPKTKSTATKVRRIVAAKKAVRKRIVLDPAFKLPPSEIRAIRQAVLAVYGKGSASTDAVSEKNTKKGCSALVARQTQTSRASAKKRKSHNGNRKEKTRVYSV